MRFLDLAADLAAVVSASRSVATKHAVLRSRQLASSYPSSDVEKEPVSPESDVQGTSGDGAGEAPNDAQASTAKPAETEPASPPPVHDTPEKAPAAEAAPKPIEDAPKPQEAAEAVELDLPTFLRRSPLRKNAPPPPPLGGGPPKPHPLDPRFLNTRLPMVGAKPPGSFDEFTKLENKENDKPARLVDAIDTTVFRTSEALNTTEEEEPALTTALPPSPPPISETNETPISASDETTKPVAAPSEAVLPAETPQPAAPTAETAETTETPAQEASPRTEQTPPSDDSTAAVPPTPTPNPERAAPVAEPPKRVELRESKVPASRISRIWNYSGLAAGMLGGALTESISRGFGGGSSGGGSVMLSPANLERLVAKLSQMRGAALKLGQMMSFQDAKMMPPALQQVLQRVQDGADYMPAWQRDRVLASNLGADWRDLFGEFEEKPIAAASIGQVHRATLKSTGVPVAVKIQFPGVADSINSDLDNLAILLTATKMLPKGLYLDKTIANARTELAWECDYIREAECVETYRRLLDEAGETGDSTSVFAVPEVFGEASGPQVLTMSFLEGVGVTRLVQDLTQEQRDWIGTQILRLCLLEIMQFQFMQTDPNWTNFLYNAHTNKLELLDFGASRAFPDEFIRLYVRLLRAAAQSDHDGVQALSRDLGYLTGHESRAMLDAHTQSVLTLAEPFRDDSPLLYDFQDQTITDRVRSFIPVMVRERLAPPPEETYSLHRKLSGAFLLCARLGSRVRCRELFEASLNKMGPH